MLDPEKDEGVTGGCETQAWASPGKANEALHTVDGQESVITRTLKTMTGEDVCTRGLQQEVARSSFDGEEPGIPPGSLMRLPWDWLGCGPDTVAVTMDTAQQVRGGPGRPVLTSTPPLLGTCRGRSGGGHLPTKCFPAPAWVFR